MAKILLVEDDPNIRMAAEFALSDAGHSIVACDNGTDGFASALSIEPDLILLDLMLPGMSGHDFLKEYRAQNASVPIIVLTAYTSEQEKVLCLDLGADDFISKPFFSKRASCAHPCQSSSIDASCSIPNRLG